MAIGLASGSYIIIRSFVFFPSLSAMLLVAGTGRGAFRGTPINMTAVLRHLNISGSESFSCRRPHSSISFERSSELIRIKSNICSLSPLKSITVPRNVQFTDG
jgi:hypothetical protein